MFVSKVKVGSVDFSPLRSDRSKINLPIFLYQVLIGVESFDLEAFIGKT